MSNERIQGGFETSNPKIIQQKTKLGPFHPWLLLENLVILFFKFHFLSLPEHQLRVYRDNTLYHITCFKGPILQCSRRPFLMLNSGKKKIGQILDVPIILMHSTVSDTLRVSRMIALWLLKLETPVCFQFHVQTHRVGGLYPKEISILILYVGVDVSLHKTGKRDMARRRICGSKTFPE